MNDGILKVADLLDEAHLLRRFDPTVEHSMARRAKNPNHVPFEDGHGAPRAVALVLRLVGDLQHAALAARGRLTHLRQIGVTLAKARHDRVAATETAHSAAVVGTHGVGVFEFESTLITTTGTERAIRRAISLVRPRLLRPHKLDAATWANDRGSEPKSARAPISPRGGSIRSTARRAIARRLVPSKKGRLTMGATSLVGVAILLRVHPAQNNSAGCQQRGTPASDQENAA